jgi:Fe-S-cluster containining protein
VDLDCRACGACCASPFDDLEPFVAVTPADAARLGAARALVVADPRAASGLGLATASPSGAACARCAALEDEPGGRVRCAVYDARPDACRAVEPGGAYCLESRARRGLVSPGS